MTARQIELSPQAERDLVELETYLRREAGAATAARAIARVMKRLGDLLVFPESAPLYAHLDGAPRLAAVRPWTIVYEYDAGDDMIRVWRVVDGRRDLPRRITAPGAET